jgi:hypothetical protein
VVTAEAVSSEGTNSPLNRLFTASTNKPHSVLNTVDDTTKGLPVVGGVTSPVLKTVGGVTEGLPVVGGSGKKAAPAQAGGEMTEEQLKAKKKKALALKKKQLELEAAEMEMED